MRTTPVTRRRQLEPKTAATRSRTALADGGAVIGSWGFAPGGEDAAFARGRLQLEPTGRARWEPPRDAHAPGRAGLWCVQGSRLLIALDGSGLFAGPVVPMPNRLLWGRGIWVRLPRAAARRFSLVRVRPRPMGTRVRSRSRLIPLTALVASVATLSAALIALLPIF